MSSSTLTIGAVIAQLQDEFPDLSLSKVRFLDAQGIVSPERTASGYRRYTQRDVDRLQFVLRCQRDRFWPLKVIREALDAYDRGLEPAGDDARPVVPTALAAQDDTVPDVEQLRADAPQVHVTDAELARTCGLTVADVHDLVSFGLLHRGADGHFDGHSVPIAAAAATLMSYGVQARHLRPFRLAADREVGLVDQLSFGGQDDRRAQVVRECMALHLALVRAALAPD